MSDHMVMAFKPVHWDRFQSGDARKIKRERRKVVKRMTALFRRAPTMENGVVLRANEECLKPASLSREARTNSRMLR